MRYFLDTEFIEYPSTIDLISVGIVAEDGREFYAISSEFDESKASDWVEENVIAHLDGPRDTREGIRTGILHFIGDDPKPEFWGYYADYDWVVFCWLFGTMMSLPKHFPKYCRDLKQLLDMHGNPKIEIKPDNAHHALSDARWNKRVYQWMEDVLRFVTNGKKNFGHDDISPAVCKEGPNIPIHIPKEDPGVNLTL